MTIFFAGQSFVLDICLFGNLSLAIFLVGTLIGGHLFVGQSFVLDIFLFGNLFGDLFDWHS